jgi:iron-sulfur cluster assembly protein
MKGYLSYFRKVSSMYITDEAKDIIVNVLREQNIRGIRLYFVGIGCEMPNIGLAFEEAKEGDAVKIVNGIRVAIEKEILPYTDELMLDQHMTPYGPGLALVGVKTQ